MKIDEIESQQFTEFELDSLVSFIRRNCRQWLLASDGKIVYRGIKSTVDDVAFIRKVRTDRRPKDSTGPRHLILNELMNRVGNVNRENSAFVTSDLDTASYHGRPYVFLPVGNFEYAWSPKFNDWTTNFDLYLMIKDDSPANDILVPNLWIHVYNYFRDHFADAWKDDGVKSPIAADAAKKYVDENIDLSKVSRYIINNRELPRAISMGHEIMIKANSGLYVNPSVYHRISDSLKL